MSEDQITQARATEVSFIEFLSEQTEGAPQTVDPPAAPAPTRNIKMPLTLVACVVAIGVTILTASRTPEEPLASSAASTVVPAPPPDSSLSEPTAPQVEFTTLSPLPISPPVVARRGNPSAAVAAVHAVEPRPIDKNAPHQQTVVERQLLPPPIQGGSLEITSAPERAKVFVNTVYVGETPLLMHDLPVGSRVVRLELDGHERWSAAVRIVASEQTRVTAKLVPLSNR